MTLSPEQRREVAGAIEREVARGALTPEQAEARRRQFGITPAGELPTYSDLEVLRQLRVRDGEDELAVLRDLHANGERLVAENRAQIDAHRDWLQRVADDRARQEFEASPEGRRLQAAQLADQQAMRAADAERARLLLASEDTYPTSDIEKLSDDEAIVAAGFESTLDPATDIPANIAAAESDTGGEAA